MEIDVDAGGRAVGGFWTDILGDVLIEWAVVACGGRAGEYRGIVG